MHRNRGLSRSVQHSIRKTDDENNQIDATRLIGFIIIIIFLVDMNEHILFLITPPLILFYRFDDYFTVFKCLYTGYARNRSEISSNVGELLTRD